MQKRNLDQEKFAIIVPALQENQRHSPKKEAKMNATDRLKQNKQNVNTIDYLELAEKLELEKKLLSSSNSYK